ncbi:MAG: hypothetical protein J6K80_08985, partial [Oscillospiraceae bacterium]|nr:hypothetical protein [Oscillospiraceae bacterium]
QQVKLCENLALDDERLEKYLTGSEIPAESDARGWCLVTAGGYSTGWGKSDGTVVKNHYPKGLRIMK